MGARQRWTLATGIVIWIALAGCGDASSDDDETPDGGGDGDAVAGHPLDDEDDGPQPDPQFLVAAEGTCPGFVEGDGCRDDGTSLVCTFAPGDVPPRDVRIWFDESARDIQSPLVFFFHGLSRVASDATMALFGLGDTHQAILDDGGILVSLEMEEGRMVSPTVSPWKLAIQDGLFEPDERRYDDVRVMDEVIACAEEHLGVNSRRIHSTGMSAGGLMTGSLIYNRSGYLASVAPFSGGIMGLPDEQDPENKMPVMMSYGGPRDTAVGQNFEEFAESMSERLQDNGNFHIICDHGNGHLLDQDLAPFSWQFLKDHPFGVPSPYEEGLPDGFSDTCVIP